MARAVSGPETVHQCHTMNWSRQVYGTDLLDYGNLAPEVYDHSWKLYENANEQILSQYPGLNGNLQGYCPFSKFNFKIGHIHSDKFLEWFFSSKNVKIKF